MGWRTRGQCLAAVTYFSALVTGREPDLPSKHPLGAPSPKQKSTRSRVRIHPSRRLKGVEGDANVGLNRFRLLVIGLVVAAVGLAACTTATPIATPSTGTAPTSPAIPTTPASPTATPTATATPTPSPTLDADQAAALDVVERYSAVMAKVRANPAKYDQYKMIELLKPLAFDDMIQANLNGIQPWRDKRWRETGSSLTVSQTASQVSRVDGVVKVTVDVCRDQRDLVVVKKNGKPVGESDQQPDFVRRSYELRRSEEATFKVYQSGGEEVSTCEA